MLFDLRGRGRRRTIQVIYLGLAVLMGGGLVFFGIGGNSSGGLFDAIGLGGSSSHKGPSISSTFAKQQTAAEKAVTANPKDTAAWGQLARVRFLIAKESTSSSQGAPAFTAAGRRRLPGVKQAWTRYLALSPAHPNPDIASLMVLAFAPEGLNDPAAGAQAQEIVTQARPSPNSYAQLAFFAYRAGQTRKGDLAVTQALALTPASQRASVKQQLDQLKSAGASAPAGAATPRPAGK
ncbi:MAG TPA: hypothetical protein VHE14_01845 [Solirubrobacteraceae bacterium]|nr:hypothetical protein [Solirubrobacteraceae bacterium]